MPFYYAVKRTLLNSHPLRQGRAYNSETMMIHFRNPRECVFFNSLLYMWVCDSVCLSVYTAPFGHNEKRYEPEIWYTHSPRSYLKTGFLFFRKNNPEDS